MRDEPRLRPGEAQSEGADQAPVQITIELSMNPECRARANCKRSLDGRVSTLQPGRRVFSMRNLNDQQVNEHSLKWPKIDSFGERRERPEVVRSRSHLKPTPDPGEDSRGGNHRVNVYNRARVDDVDGVQSGASR